MKFQSSAKLILIMLISALFPLRAAFAVSCLTITHLGQPIEIPSGASYTDTWPGSTSESCPSNTYGTVIHYYNYNQNLSCVVGSIVKGDVSSSFSGLDTNSCFNILITDPTPIPLTSCTTITSPGHYVLQNDIVGNYDRLTNPYGHCLRIMNSHDVDVDCKGHKILAANGIGFLISNVNNFNVKNCDIQTGVGFIENSSYGNFAQNNFGEVISNTLYSFTVNSGAHHIVIANNRFSATVQLMLSNYNVVSRNTVQSPVTGTGRTISACVLSDFGFGNVIDSNTIDGRAKGSISVDLGGADDGIILQEETQTIVSNNSITNVWDTGIEWLGLVNQSKITGNVISNSSFSGIGGWYWMGLSNSNISFNTISNSLYMFQIFRVYELRLAGYDLRNPSLVESTYYLNGNRFESNFYAADGTHSAGQFLIDNIYGRNPLVAGGNVFVNNYFGMGRGLTFDSFYKPNEIGFETDGGGNSCNTFGFTTYPLTCRTPLPISIPTPTPTPVTPTPRPSPPMPTPTPTPTPNPFPNCTRVAPTVSVFPVSQNIPLGGTTTVLLTIKNNHTGDCGTVIFNVFSATVPEWIISPRNVAISLAPSATTNMVFSVSAPALTSNGTYPISILATDALNAGVGAGVGALFVVGSTPTPIPSATATPDPTPIATSTPTPTPTAPPSPTATPTPTPAQFDVTISSDRSTYKRGNTVRLIITAKQNGIPVGSASISVSFILPDGRVATMAGNTNGSGQAKIDYHSKPNDPIGSYLVKVTVTKQGQNGSSQIYFNIQ